MEWLVTAETEVLRHRQVFILVRTKQVKQAWQQMAQGISIRQMLGITE